MRRGLPGALAIAIGLLAAGLAQAQGPAYPVRPVRVVVPFPPGGTVDIVARTFAQKLGEQTGQTFLVENRAGANGVVGSDGVAKAAPDGYTLLVNASIHVINPLLMKNVPFDVERDFTPISNLGSVPLLVTAHPSVPASNLREFMAVAKADPKKYTFATSGLGSAGHLTVEMIMREAKLPLLLVAYKGAGPALNDLVGGQVSSMADPFPSSYPQVKGGRLKPLAVTSARRSPLLPDVMTVAEAGLAGFEMVSWYGLWGPAKLPREIVARLTTESAKAAQAADVKDRLAAQGFDAAGSSPEAFAAYISEEIRKYARVIKEADIKVE